MSRKKSNIKLNKFSIVFPLLTIIVIGLIIISSSTYDKTLAFNWNGVRKEIKDSIKIAVNDKLSFESESYARRSWIMKNATSTELRKLTEYPNGLVKTIAYEGLIRKSEVKNKVELIINAFEYSDYTVEDYSGGCVATPKYIGQYIVENVLVISPDWHIPPEAYNPMQLKQPDINLIIDRYKKQGKYFDIQ